MDFVTYSVIVLRARVYIASWEFLFFLSVDRAKEGILVGKQAKLFVEIEL